MEFNTYQLQAKATAVYPRGNLAYPYLGLAGESGEVCEKVKKLIRDKNSVIDDAYKNDIKKELGDVLWYIANIAQDLDISLDDIAQTNLTKLASRKERGVLGGSGDNR